VGKPPVEAVVFDLGGVLIDWNPRYLYRSLFDDEAEMEAFLRDICSPAWNLEQDRGRPFAEAIKLLCAEFPGYASHIAAYFERWHEMLRGPIEGTVEILRELRETGRVRLFALTNWSAETFHHAEKRFPFLGWFEGIVVSGREGLVKPDPAFYRLLTDRYALEPGHCLFIDDVERNVEGALAAGMQAVRFESPAALRRELQERCVLH